MLASVTLLSIAFRLGPLDFVPEPDEYRVEGHLENFYRTRSLEPVNWIHPPTTQYLCWAVETAHLKLAGAGPLYEGFAHTYALDPGPIYRRCRRAHWILAVATAPVASWLSGAIFGSQAVAFVSGALVAASFSHASRSALALTDAPVTLFFTLAIGLACLAWQRRRPRLLYVAAVAAAGAALMKMNGAVSLLPIAAVLWLMSDDALYATRRAAAAAALAGLASGATAVIVTTLSGAWVRIVELFGRDGGPETESMAYMQQLMFKMSLAAAVSLLAVAILAWRLHAGQAFAGPGLGRWLDKTLSFLSSPSLYLVLGLFTTTFVILHPYSILRFKVAAADFVLTIIHVRLDGHFGMEGPNWVWYVEQLWTEEHLLGVVFLIGVVSALLTGRGVTRWLAIFLMLLFVDLGAWAEKAVRFVLPLVPLTAVVTAAALWPLVERRSGATRALFFGGLGAVLLTQAVFVSVDTRARSAPDPRRLARDWIEQNVPAGRRLLIDLTMVKPRNTDVLHLIRTHLPGSAAATLTAEYLRRPVYSVRLFESALDCEQKALDLSRVDIVVLVSASFEPFLDASQVPPVTSSRHARYLCWRHVYRSVLSGALAGLGRVAEFGSGDPRSPRVLVYRVIVPARSGS